MKKMKWMSTALVLVLAAGTAHAQYDYETADYTIQALLGGVKYDGLTFENSDGTDSVSIDMSTLPQLGGAWSTLPKGDKLQYGLECTFLLGFKFDDVTTYSGAHSVYINVSSYLWLFDLGGGAYANLNLGERLRIYGAAGPLLMLSIYSSDSEYEYISQSDTAFGFGAYARAGLELKVHEKGWLGAGIRGNWSSLDFSDVGGSSDISGLAAFLTYTAGL